MPEGFIEPKNHGVLRHGILCDIGGLETGHRGTCKKKSMEGLSIASSRKIFQHENTFSEIHLALLARNAVSDCI